MTNRKVMLTGVGVLISGLGALGLNFSLASGADTAIAMCVAVLFFGIQIFYDGIKLLLKLN